MPAQQGLLNPVNTGVTFGLVNDSKADRLFHNGTDIAKAEFIFPKPSYGYYIATNSISGTLVTRPEYIDESYSAIATVDAYYFQIEYPTVVTSTGIKIYTTTFISDMPTSGTAEVYRAYTVDGFLSVSGISTSYVFRTDLSPQQYEYTIAFSTEQSGKYWKFRFKSGTSTLPARNVTEVIVKSRPNPILRYFNTSGGQTAVYSTEKDDLLDICYDYTNSKYYTIRFNSQSAGSGLDPNDDFSTESGTTNFSSRWYEDTQDASFYRSISADNLVFSTTSGNGRLRSNYTVSGDCHFKLDYAITTLSGNNSFFGLNAIDADSNRLLYGIGVSRRDDFDNYYKVAVTNFIDAPSADLLELKVDLENATSGSEDWRITYNSSLDYWTVSGTVHGSQSNAYTGQIYTNNYLSFQISSAQTPVNNDYFSFTSKFDMVTRTGTSDQLDIERTGSTFTTANDSGTTFDEIIGTNNLQIEIYGTTKQTVNITADDFYKFSTSGYSYPSVPVFTIERVDATGTVQQTIVEKLNVIKDPTKTYNTYLDGAVQLAVTGGQILYVKVLDLIYRFSVASPIAGLVDESTPGVTVSLPGVIPAAGVYSFHYSESNGGFLGYVYYDPNTSLLQVKTLTASAPPTPQTRKCFLNIPDWLEHQNAGVPYQLYLHAVDENSAFYYRRHGTTLLNSNKVTSTAGVANGTTVFTDSSVNYSNSNVKRGDLVIVNESGYAGNGTYRVVTVNSSTSLTLDRTLAVKTGIDYTIVSNAEQMQLNLDPTITAFSAVNVDDYSLNAGTSDTTYVNVEVISAWGDALVGKTVQFQITQGDGVIYPATAVTSGGGIAQAQYTVGTTAGTVQIQATVSD